MMSKNDIAWKRYFDNTNTLQQIDDAGFAFVQSDDLKRIARREPRLMAKQDTLSTRPRIFREQQIGILPTKNGQYILFRDTNSSSFYQFTSDEIELPTETYHSEIDLNTFDAYPGSQRLNESQAIDFAYVSSLLRTFTNTETLHLVIRNRSFSGHFQFRFPMTGIQVDVAGVQIEIDAGYESHDSIFLIEAKVGKRNDFHIRQLYYPYLEWSHRSKKKIVPIFLVYSNARYYLYEFSFSPVFGELKLVRGNCYVVNESPYIDVSLHGLLSSISMHQEPSVPYPQANDLDKVIDLIGLVGQGVNNKFDIAEYFEFDERQGDYYANAASYLGFIIRDDNEFQLTDAGIRLLNTRSLTQRNLTVIKQMLQRPSIRQSFQLLLENDMRMDLIKNKKISEIIERNTNLSGTTVPRRASTVRRWLTWAIENFDFDTKFNLG